MLEHSDIRDRGSFDPIAEQEFSAVLVLPLPDGMLFSSGASEFPQGPFSPEHQLPLLSHDAD